MLGIHRDARHMDMDREALTSNQWELPYEVDREVPKGPRAKATLGAAEISAALAWIWQEARTRSDQSQGWSVQTGSEKKKRERRRALDAQGCSCRGREYMNHDYLSALVDVVSQCSQVDGVWVHNGGTHLLC